MQYHSDGRRVLAAVRRAWRHSRRRVGELALPPLIALTSLPLQAAQPDLMQLVKTECATCHTESGNSIAPPFPRLAGLAPEYISKQFRDVLAGTRKSDIMYPIAVKLSRAEINRLAGYFANQRRTQGVVTQPALVSAGEIVFHKGNPANGVPACAGCHMKDGAGAPRFPMIASQNADYVADQLTKFRSGARANDFGKLMRTTVSRLSDDEIKAVSQYVASMPPPGALPREKVQP